MASLENELKQEQFRKEMKDEKSMDKKLKILFLNEYDEIIGDILNLKQELFIDQVKEGVSLLLEDFYTIHCLTDQKLSKLIDNNLNEIKSRYNRDYSLISRTMASYEKYGKRRMNNDNFLTGFRKHCIHTSDIGCHNCCSNEKDGEKNSRFVIINDPDSKNAIKFVVCENCKKVYYSSFILAHCFKCGLDYYTSLLSPEENPELLLATWENYHCRQLINEKMKCIKCNEPFYVNMKTGLLMCLNKKCEFISKPTRILWTCYICKAEFKSKAIPYNPLDVVVTKRLVSQTLLLKHKAHPDVMPCCKINVYFTDFHHKLTCDGILYESELDDSKVIVCEKCKAINFYDRFNWTCPKCGKRFRNKTIIPSNQDTLNNTLKPLIDDNYDNKREKEIEKEIEEGENRKYHTPVQPQTQYSSRRFKKEKDKVLRDFRLNDSNPIEEAYNTNGNDGGDNGGNEKKNENGKKVDSSRKFRRFNFNFIQENRNKNEEKNKNKEKNKNEENNEDNNENDNNNNNINGRKIRSKTTYYKEENIRNEEAKKYFRRKYENDNKDKDKEKIIIEEKIIGKDLEPSPDRVSPRWRKRFKRDIYSKDSDEKEKRELEEKEKEKEKREKKEKEKREKEEKEKREKEEKERNYNNFGRGWFRRLNKEPIKNAQKEKATEFVDNDEESEENNTIDDDNKKKNKIKNGKSDEDDEKEKEENPVEPDPLYMNYKFKRNKNKKKTRGMEIIGDQDQDENKDKLLIKKKNVPHKNLAMSKIPGITEHLFNHINKRMNKILNRCKIPVFDIDDYTFNKKLGQGGYAVIFSVHKNDDKERKGYALKKIIAKTLTEIDRFTKEFELVHSCVHPNIMKIYGICIRMLDQTTYALYVLMELSLYDWNKEIKNHLMKKVNYTEEELINILRQLTSALLFMQQNLKISHRDIKPSNVLIFKDGKYKIADFGEAKEAKMSKQMNTLRGTELYMSPALYSGLKNEKNDVNHDPYKSDVFSLGFCILYAASLDMELLFQIRDIFNSKKVDAILQQTLKKKYTQTFINLLSKMMEIDEINRFDFPTLVKYIDDNYDKDGFLKNPEKTKEKPKEKPKEKTKEKRTETSFRDIIKKYK